MLTRLLVVLPFFLCFVPCEPWAITPPNLTDIYISELSTTGTFEYLDEEGDQEDWIEIHNPTGAAVSVAGLYLSDATNNLLRWEFPAINIQAGGFLVVFASEKNRRPTDGSNLHTNFALDSEGEYLAIVDSASQVISEVAPMYPPQRAAFTFGFDSSNNAYRYMNPTPSGSNDSTDSFDRLFEQGVSFSIPRGYFDTPFAVELSPLETGADVRYTTDGSAPDWDTGTVYSGPIPITETTVLRAVALIPNDGISDVVTQTYFLNLPGNLKNLPTMSLVTDIENMESIDRGITHPDNVRHRGRAWERPISVEYFDPKGGPDFQINSGIRVHGKGSRGGEKKSFRLYFRNSYGQSRLDFPLIPESDVQDFKRLVLRGGSNDTNPFVHDELTRRLLFDLGHHSSRGTFVHLFLNGKHLGFYNPCERLDAFFFESWRGGGDAWDVIREEGAVADGDGVVFNEILALADAAVANGTLPESELNQIKDRLDIINFVDYLLLNLSSGMNDWPHNNWAAARERVPGSKFRFYEWDAEDTFGKALSARTDTVETKFAQGGFSPYNPIRRTYLGLRENPKFNALFAARFRRQFYEDGAMTDTHQMIRYLSLKRIMIGALPNMNSLITYGYIPGRRQCFEQNLDNAGLLDRTGLPLSRTLVINEFMASNTSTLSDEVNDLDDWIEIYNSTESTIDLSGMFLSDRLDYTTKWEFPAGTMLAPFDYLLVWADGEMAEGDLHTNFKLDAEGERIALFDSLANGNTLLDSIEFGRQQTDVSMGRRPDGFGYFETLVVPSPGTTNGTVLFSAIPGTASQEYEIGPGGRSLAAADFNEDGFPDIVYSNFDFGTVAVLKNRGDGTFHEPVVRSTGRLGTTALVAADVNGDSHVDVVTTNDVLLEHTVSVLLNNGFGGLTLAGIYPFSSAEETKHLHPRSIVARDIDGDGYLDLVVQNESYALVNLQPVGNVVSILTNDGTGAFVETASVPVSYADLTSKQALVAEDLDSDNDVDLATVSVLTRKILVLLNDGAEGFASPIELAIPANSKPLSVAGGDFDTDGDIDLVVCDGEAGGGDVHFYLNDGSAGFSESPDMHLTLPAPVNLLVEDFSSDGDSDVLAVNYRPLLTSPASLQLLSNVGSGRFEASDEFSTSADDPFPNSMTSADFNLDGDNDLAVLDEFNGTLTVFTHLRALGPQPSSIENWQQLQ